MEILIGQYGNSIMMFIVQKTTNCHIFNLANQERDDVNSTNEPANLEEVLRTFYTSKWLQLKKDTFPRKKCV